MRDGGLGWDGCGLGVGIVSAMAFDRRVFFLHDLP